MFTTPFIDRQSGNSMQQRFPVQFPPNNASVRNPDNTVNWSLFTPIASSPGFWYKNRLPHAEDYEFSVQRQFSTKTLLTLSYVGTQGHSLLSTLESNPGNPALCLSIPTCGPLKENTVFTLANGATVNGTRAPFGNNFGSNGYFMTIGQSSYNSLQANVRHNGGPLQLLLGYTYSKSMDNASGYGEQVYPFNPKHSMGLSAFDVTHNFVVSYNYQLPFDKFGWKNRLTQGWQLSGITRFFSTGVPVTLYDMSDNSLLGTAYTGPMPIAIDTPNFAGGSVYFNHPRQRPNPTSTLHSSAPSL